MREIVSSDTSASHQPSPNATTVRQQPLTAIDSPISTPVDHARCADAQAPVVERFQSAEFFDDSGEHQVPSCRGSRSGDDLEPHVVADAFDDVEAAAPEVVDRGCGGAGDGGGGVGAGEQRRRDVEHVAVDEAGGVERPDHAGTAFDHQLDDAAPSEVVEQLVEAAAPLDARVHTGVRRRRAEHHTQRVVALDVAHGERGIVGAHGAGADEDRVALGTQPVRVAPGGLAGDPLRRSVGRRRAAVGRGGELAHHVGAARAAMVQVGRELRFHVGGADADVDRDAGTPECVEAGTGHVVVGVGDAHDDALPPRRR